MVSENTLQDVLARHVAFWECAEVERPLLWVQTPLTVSSDSSSDRPAYVLLDGSPVGDGMKIEPGTIDMGQKQAMPEDRGLNVLDGDYVASWGPSPFSSFTWMEAILGCPVFHTVETSWAKPLTGDWTQLKGTGDWRDSPWLAELLAVNRSMVKATQGRISTLSI